MRSPPTRPSVFYINTLRVAGIQAEPLNLHFEQVFEVGQLRSFPGSLGCVSARLAVLLSAWQATQEWQGLGAVCR